jgi:hypothetical protein
MVAVVYYHGEAMVFGNSTQEGTATLLRFPNESYMLYTSWLGLAGERRGPNRQPRAAKWSGIGYYCAGREETGVERTATQNPGSLMGVAYAKTRGRQDVSPSESFSLFTPWLGFDGLEDENAATQTAGSLTAALPDQPKADPYILHCIG